MCTHFHIPFDVDYHVIAWKPLIDNERVVHHVLLFGCHETGKYFVIRKIITSILMECFNCLSGQENTEDAKGYFLF